MAKYHNKSKKIILFTLVFTIVIYAMGGCLIFPLLPALFLSTSANSLVAPHVPLTWRYALYAISFIIWPLGTFFGTPFLGTLSDRFGRKIILIICLIATALNYIIMGIAVENKLIFVFFAGRLLSGFFGGSYDIAQAAAADISAPEDKARNMGWIAFAVAVGFVIGPVISGFTSEKNIVCWFSLATPFWISAILACLNIIFILIFLKETFISENKVKVNFFKALSSFKFIFTDNRVFVPGTIFFITVVGWGLYLIAMPLILAEYFHFNIQNTGLFFCVLGIGYVSSILFLQKPLLKKFSLDKIFIFSSISMVLIFLTISICPVEFIIWISAFLLAVLDILNYSSLLALCSNAVTSQEQGKLMGGTGAVASAAFLVTGFILVPVTKLYILLAPVVVAVAYIIGSLILYIKIKKHNIHGEKL